MVKTRLAVPHLTHYDEPFRLTAFVAKSFHQAKHHIYIDDYTLTRAITWLINNQAADGHFPEPGHVHNTFLQVCSNISVEGLAKRKYFKVIRQTSLKSLFEVFVNQQYSFLIFAVLIQGQMKSFSLQII